MGLFDSFLGDLIGNMIGDTKGSPTIRGPSRNPRDYEVYEDTAKAAAEAVKMVTTDLRFEGKKEGYNKTAAIYEQKVSVLKLQFEYCKNILNSTKESINKTFQELLKFAKQQEQKRQSLLESLKKSNPDAYSEFVDNGGTKGIINIPKMKSISFSKGIYTLLKNANNKSWTEGFIEGCQEAETIYNKKIEDLISDFLKEKNEVENELSQRPEKIKELLKDIKKTIEEISELELANSI